MTQLHELLAVHKNLENQVAKTSGELADTFEKKQQRFGETVIVTEWKEEGKAPSTVVQASLQTTVGEELKWISKFFVKAMDVATQIDAANQKASASITLDDGRTIASDVPVTTLLELEKRLTTLQELFAKIPTLDPTQAFEIDPTFRKPGVYKSREVIKPKTAKIDKALVLYEATKEHPAQVKEKTYDVEIGQTRTIEWSGMITPAEKAGIHARVDEMIRAVKKARAVANAVEVDQTRKIGAAIMDYLVTG